VIPREFGVDEIAEDEHVPVVMPVAGTIRFVVALARLCLLIQGLGSCTRLLERGRKLQVMLVD
jgi:hypothetical protein